jgi:RNA polymerase-binding transcription factor DksA
MATKKKAAKPAPKKVVKPVKKSAPAKKPVAKVVAKKPAAKPAKVIAKKPTPAKVAAKKPAKVAVKAKPAVKVVAKKIASKPVAKVAPTKVIVAAKTIQKPMPKKIIETKKPVAKPAPVAEKQVAAPAKPVALVKPKDIKVAPPKPVVLPKINTKTSRTYQPDFTKSVLDQPKHDLGAPIVRYNDTDLAEFRELIQRKLESAKKELGYLQGLITRKDEMGGDNDDARYMTMEDGSMSMEREQLSQMASRQITFIDHLEKALMRIENQTYGICRVTGKLIDKARLRAVPHATLSIEAKMSGGK